MSGRARLLLWLALVAPAGALAQPQFLFGARAGAAFPREDGFGWGLSVGADAAWAMHRLAALELAVDHSFHAISPAGQGGETTYGTFTVADLGVQYRIDVTPRFVPYVVLAVESRWSRFPGGDTVNRFGGAFAVGLLAPFAERWFAGIEARYGISPVGEFPLRQAYLARIGYTTASF